VHSLALSALPATASLVAAACDAPHVRLGDMRTGAFTHSLAGVLPNTHTHTQAHTDPYRHRHTQAVAPAGSGTGAQRDRRTQAMAPRRIGADTGTCKDTCIADGGEGAQGIRAR
jgi:hypothetical protein